MRMRAIMGLVSALITSCSASQTAAPLLAADETCQASDLAAVFANPLAHDGKLFCGHAILVSERFIAFYPRAPQSDEERFGTVLLPKISATQVKELARIGTLNSLWIRGRIEVDRDCLSGESLCTPIKRPIALTNFSFER